MTIVLSLQAPNENMLTINGIKYELSKKKKYLCFFDAASIGLIIDNVFSNSFKAHADKMRIDFSEDEKSVTIKLRDNGIGLKHGINPNTLL